MRKNYREIEKKFRVSDADSLRVLGTRVEVALIQTRSDFTSIPTCQTEDLYWLPPSASTIQFARVRDSQGRSAEGEYRILKELTIKAKDRGDNFNRLEINLGIDGAKKASDVLTLLLGTASTGVIQKEEQIWFVKALAGEVVVSTALVNGELYLEVEGEDESDVWFYVEALREFITLIPEPRSFFELYIKKGAA